MNKRIKELAEQAGLVQGGWANADRVKIWKEDPDNPGSLEKFAELIVRECAEVCMKEIDIGWAMAPKSPWMTKQILEHFGVEE